MSDFDEITFMSVGKMVELVHSMELSPVEICDHFLGRIEEFNDAVNAFCTTDIQAVREQARLSELALRRGDRLKMHGIPVGVKDLIFTKGLRTTGGSTIYADLVPDQDDIAVSRLRQAGAVVLGKTNTAEFGFSANQTENALFGATRNPWNLETSPGGSSGGSAAAVAAGLCPIALGSDGGGSVRIPSALCGLFGFKPTFGTVPLFPGCRDPRYPGLSAWESVEHIGPIAHTVADGALMVDVLSGPDLRDRHSLHSGMPTKLSDGLDANDLTGLTIAWSRDWGGLELVDEDVLVSFDVTIGRLADLGASLQEVSPDRAAAREHFAALVAADADPAAFRRAIRGYEGQVNPRVMQMLEREWTFDQVAAAITSRKTMQIVFTEFFDRFDAYLTPTVPFAALPLGQEGPTTIAGHELDVPARAVIGFCYPFNLTGHPAASVPSGSSSSGTPIGIQVVSRWGRDDVVLHIASVVERLSGHQGRHPDLFRPQLGSGRN